MHYSEFFDPMLMHFSRSHLEQMPWYAYKKEIRNYLAELNKDKKVGNWIT
jgi:hypothetical protein